MKKVLLASTASYAPPRGGSTRSNLAWLRALVRQGWECRVVCTAATDARAARERAEQGEGENAGISIVPVDQLARRSSVLRDEIQKIEPDWVLVSSEDVGQSLLRAAAQAAADRIVYLAHTPQFFPLGPESWNPQAGAAEVVRSACGVVAISEYVAGMLAAEGIAARVIHPPMYGQGPFEQAATFDSGFVLTVNPCAVKGITIFLALSDRFPRVKFAALPGWGTTGADREALERRPNVEVLPGQREMKDAWLRTKVLLVPSMWAEGFGLVVMEAMRHGVPVLASDHAGLRESKRGTGYLLPVNPVERYEPVYDDRNMPRAVVNQQPVDEWARALERLLSDREEWIAEARRSREAAARFMANQRDEALGEYLHSLERKSGGRAASGFAALPAEKRRLLLERLKGRS